MELVRIGVGRLDDKVRAVSFRLFLADSRQRVGTLPFGRLFRFRQRVGTLPFGRLFRFRVAEPKAAPDGLLPLVAAALDFLQVTGEVVLRRRWISSRSRAKSSCEV